MANLSSNPISLSAINGGRRYQNGDTVDANAINASIEASYYAQELARAAQTAAMAALDKVQGALGASSAFSLLDAYPIGSIYLSVSPTSPASLFGGSWTRIQDRFLLAAGSNYSAGDRGGSADAVLVEHMHQVDTRGNVEAVKGYGALLEISETVTNDAQFTSVEGESGIGKNMPPYIAVYMWQRTA